MSYFSHLKRVKAKRLEIAELDKEIASLYAKKSELELSNQKLELEFETLSDKIKKLNTLLTLDEQIDKANNTIVSLNTEINEEKEELEKLKREHPILRDCISYEELRNKLLNEVDGTLKKIFNKYPNVRPVRLHILDEFNGFYDNRIALLDLQTVVDSNLTKFALSHGIEPVLYKELMYSYNSSWYKLFKEFQVKYNSLNVKSHENEQLFNGFITLVDKKK